MGVFIFFAPFWPLYRTAVSDFENFDFHFHLTVGDPGGQSRDLGGLTKKVLGGLKIYGPPIVNISRQKKHYNKCQVSGKNSLPSILYKL